MSLSTHEPSSSGRFAFGKNWQRFLELLDDQRIAQAERSLSRLLGVDNLRGKTFLDVGSGSGLFSLAARRLGAGVYSFDCDEQSVACTRELQWRYAPQDPDWTIQPGSILDTAFVGSLPKSDVVYSWGVLHHTGAMWQALEHVAALVHNDGQVAISIYNDQGGASRRWRSIKRLYNRLPGGLQPGLVLGVGAFIETRSALIRLLRLQNPLPFRDWAGKKQDRGMSPWHDLVDWVGGYPFEVAKPEEIFNFFRQRGFTLTYLTTQGSGYGCNEYVFSRAPVTLGRIAP